MSSADHPSTTDARSPANPADALAVDVVTTFLRALEDEDLATVEALLHDDVVYTNVGAATIRGSRRVARVFRALFAPRAVGFEAYDHRVAAHGGAVLTERTDVLRIGPVRWTFWVCGTFEVRDGRIVLWRDHFDYGNLTVGLVRGLIGAVVPPLRPRPPQGPPGRSRVPGGPV